MNTAELYRNIISYIDSGRGCRLITAWSGDEGLVKELSRKILPLNSSSIPQDLPKSRKIRQSLSSEQNGFPIQACMNYSGSPISDCGHIMCEVFTPSTRLIVFGGGHICLPLVQFASRTGFSVTVIDDRPEFANVQRFPEADCVICEPFPQALEELRLTPYDYVCILTRGHHFDGECLRGIHKLSQPAYIGMIGSRRRVRAQFDMLEKEGIDRKWLDSIHTPIGLDIGAVTPAEIAVSILAELVLCRRRTGAEKSGADGLNMEKADTEKAGMDSLGMENTGAKKPGKNLLTAYGSDVEENVLRFLADNNKPQAIATIIEAKGSTPRSGGAKMSVGTDGRITGTIGGGYAEGLVIDEAKKLIGTGRYIVRSIDLNGDVASSDGMACGGSLVVLVEDCL